MGRPGRSPAPSAMRNHIELRRAGDADAAVIAEIWLRSFRATYDFPPAHPDEDVRRWVREDLVPGTETWVAVERAVDGVASRIVAFMALDGDDLAQLYVDPDRLRRGIGSTLLSLAKARRPGGLGLFTFQANAAARAFYERHGFRVVWLGDGSANEERQPDLRYAWSAQSAAAPGPATR
jgi:ribosomal protein S18 acetylase RimI-like enzyme